VSGLPLSDGDVEIAFVRSAGPGGQNVNKVATAAQLRFNITRYPHLDAAAKHRLRRLAGRRLTDADDILIIARNHRTQEGNRRDAMERLTALLEQARPAPIPRRATRPTRASKERRLSGKASSSRLKQLRGRVRGDD
jgi:ribosome-associated protein